MTAPVDGDPGHAGAAIAAIASSMLGNTCRLVDGWALSRSPT